MISLNYFIISDLINQRQRKYHFLKSPQFTKNRLFLIVCINDPRQLEDLDKSEIMTKR